MEDLLIKNNISDWTPAVENELMRWSNNSKINKELHSDCHSYYKRHYQWLSIPVIVLSTIAGAANFIVNTLLTTEQDKTYANVSIGIVNLCVGVLSTLMNFFKLAEKEQLHKKSAEDYENISTLIDAKLGLQQSERGDAREFYNLISKEYTRLKTYEVHIKKVIRRKFRRANKHMISRHEVEFPDSLSTVENLYHPAPKYKTNNGSIPLPVEPIKLKTKKSMFNLMSSTNYNRNPGEQTRVNAIKAQSNNSNVKKDETTTIGKLQSIWNNIMSKTSSSSTSNDISRSSTDNFTDTSLDSYNSAESASPPNTPTDESDISNSNIQVYNSNLNAFPDTPQTQTTQLHMHQIQKIPQTQLNVSQLRPPLPRAKTTKVMSIQASPMLQPITQPTTQLNGIQSSIISPRNNSSNNTDTPAIIQSLFNPITMTFFNQDLNPLQLQTQPNQLHPTNSLNDIATSLINPPFSSENQFTISNIMHNIQSNTSQSNTPQSNTSPPDTPPNTPPGTYSNNTIYDSLTSSNSVYIDIP